MTFGQTPVGQTVRYCGREFIVVEHWPAARPGGAVTVCQHWNARLKTTEEMKFNSDLPCEPLTDHGHQPLPQQ